MKVLVSGASGLVGSQLCDALAASANTLGRLVRHPPTDSGEVLWDPGAERFDAGAAENVDAIVHLAGENISSGRWTEERKRRIRDSRVEGTRFLVRSILELSRPPEIVIVASAVGFYGDTGERKVDEAGSAGEGFLAGVCREWEAACEPLRGRGIRVVNLRFGVVLSTAGGALATMLPVFRLGFGGRLGSGTQWMSWIAIDDVVGVIELALTRESVSGPVNVVAPQPIRNSEFTTVLGRVLGRPTILPAPGFALRLAMGEMAEELLLSSSRVVPRVLLREGYAYRHRELEETLRALLASPR